MAGDNFDLQGWMREQRQGPYTGAKGAEKVALKSSKPKSKTGLNEGLMGMIDLQPVGHLSEEFNDDDFKAGMNDEKDLDNYFNSYPEDNELGKDEIAKELVNISSGHLNSRDFKDYIKDYYLNPEEYKIDTNSKYYEAITYAYKNEYEAYELYDDQFEDNTENQMNEDDDMDDAPEIEDTWNKPSEFDKDDDEEKMAAMAMKQAKSSKKGMKGITSDWTIDDILGGDEYDDDL